jgi:hypothetical protein
MAWGQFRVKFIPKPEKSDYTKANAYLPISLSSFLSKAMEKLEDMHIRYSSHQNQHAYQSGRTTESAFYIVVTHTEEHCSTLRELLAEFHLT